ncbi:MAG TPA: hypothetical protein VHU19_12205 [Pyrinomonadaceae bacterium]|jgi:hypothetical protein|nr:hypothetical protein [Pyrinomonadaceae bacterium]
MLTMIFEVIDKEPSLLNVWALFLLVGATGFLLCRLHRACLGLTLPIAVLLSLGYLTELHDPYIGPAILNEAGRGYFLLSYVAMSIALLLPVTGALIPRLKRRQLR